MSAEQLLIANLVRSAVVLTLVGLLVRGRVRQCWTFFVYLLAILVCNSLISFWPERFYRLWFYVLKESVYDILKVSIAAELAFRVFRAFPGASRRARMLVAPLIFLIMGGLLVASYQADDKSIVVLYHPQIQTATIWLFTATTLLAVWYNLPIGRFHRALLMGFTAYLIVFVTLINILRQGGFSVAWAAAVGSLDGYAYLALVLLWAWAAWQPRLPEMASASARLERV